MRCAGPLRLSRWSRHRDVVRRSKALARLRRSGRSAFLALARIAFRRATCRSDGYDLDELVEGQEVIGIAGVERKANRTRCRCDQQVDGSRSASLSARSGNGGVDAAVRTRRLGVEWQRVEDSLRSLKPVLPASALVRVLSGVRTRSELGHRDRADGRLDGELRSVDALKVDDDRRVEQTPRPALVNHEARRLGWRCRLGRRGTGHRQQPARCGTSQRRRRWTRSDGGASGSVLRRGCHCA